MYSIPAVRVLPLRDRLPYQAWVWHNAGACTLAEILAAVVGGSHQTEIAHGLLARFDSLTRLTQASAQELEAIPNLGTVGATRIKAALELGQRVTAGETPTTIRSPNDIAGALIAKSLHLEQEHFFVILLDARNGLIDITTLYIANLNQTHVRVAEVFRKAIQRNCAAIIVAHNHPSGGCIPSPEDIELTRALVQAGNLLGIEVLDHIVVGGSEWTSMRDKGLGF